MNKENPSIIETINNSPSTWSNSANILCNYMQKEEYLISALKNKGITPRYCIENIEYLNIEGLNKIAFPMTCFCDIPLAKAKSHMERYGKYGIAFDKAKMINKFKIQPIHYINSESNLCKSFSKTFSNNYGITREDDDMFELLRNNLTTSLLYMKPLSGQDKFKDQVEIRNFQDECEWRYIPFDNFPDSLSFILVNDANEPTKEECNKVLMKHPKTRINFEWEDIRYLIVQDDASRKDIINAIVNLEILEEEKYNLISKIEVSDRFSKDLI